MKIIHVLIFLILCVIAAGWAHSLKRRGMVWFFIAFFCTPLIAYIILLIFSIKKATIAVKKTAEATTATLQTAALHKKIYSEQEDVFLEKALAEIEESQQNKALWAKALVESDGNESKARAKYIKKRCEQMLMDEVATRTAEATTMALSENEKRDSAERAKSVSAQLHRQAHLLHYERGDPEQARYIYEEILRNHPNSKEAASAQYQVDKLKKQEEYKNDKGKT